MNIYAIIILATIALDFILNLIADLLNLKHMSGDLPEEFEGVYDQEAYQKSQDYTRTNTRFGFITSGFNLIVTLVFWFSGGFNWIDTWVRGFQLHAIWSGLIYVGVLMGLLSLISLPFSIYSTFVIEEKFGFNKTTTKTFILDLVKGLLLSIGIGGPLLAGILAFFAFAGHMAWLYCWAVTTVFTLILQFIAPTWIMPLFNKFTPLEDGDLRDSIMNYAKSVKFSLTNVFVMDGSKRSSKSNAFFTGFGKNKRIALFDTLIERHTVAEMTAVLAHEIGHYKKKHIIKGMIISILHMGIVFYLMGFFLSQQGLFNAFYMEQMSVYAGLLFFGMLYSPVELILSIFMNIMSRKHEFEADKFAVDTTHDGQPMIDALKKLSVHNLSNLRPHSIYVFFNYSHPPVLTRIQFIRSLTNQEK